MTGFIIRLLAALALAWPTPVLAAEGQAGLPGSQARPLRVEDIVSTEAIVRASISPDGRWAVYERRAAYDQAPRYDLGPRSLWAITRLWRIDLRDGGPPQLLVADPAGGMVLGPWSPDGRHLAVFHLTGARLEIGVVEVQTGAAWWTGATPDLPLLGQAAQWVDADRLAATVRPDGSPPFLLRYASPGPAALPDRWARTAEGRAASRTVIEARDGVAIGPPEPDRALVMFDVGSRDIRTLIQGSVADFAVSPDQRTIAALQADRPVPQRLDQVEQMGLERTHRLTMVDLATGVRLETLPGLDVAPHLLAWSSDGAEVLIWTTAETGEGRLVAVAPDGATRVFRQDGLLALPPGRRPDRLGGVRAGWLGRDPVLRASDAATGRADWRKLDPDRSPVALSGSLSAAAGRISAVADDGPRLVAEGRLWRLTPEGARPVGSMTGLAEPVIADLERPWRLRVNAPPRQDWTAAVAADGNGFVLGADGTPRLRTPATSRDVRWLAFGADAILWLERDGLSERLRLTDARGSREIDRVNAGLSGVVLAAPDRLEHPDAGGRPTVSLVYRPPEGTPVRGVVVEVYPGPAAPEPWSGPATLTYGLRPQVLAGAGYVVLVPALPLDLPDAQSGERLSAGVDRALDALAAEHPDLPVDRSVVVGHSWGGYAAAAIATRARRHRGYVVWAGLTDLAGYWGEASPTGRYSPADGLSLRQQAGWVETRQGLSVGPPWRDPTAWAAASPFLQANRITEPVLLITADQDFVPMSQAERLFAALARMGRRARLVTYWGEEHLLWSPANIRDLYAQIFAWLEETLNPPSTGPDPGAPPTSEPRLPQSPPS
ncbi:S9 family peptidase [Brevundimonas bacteroides]|uniref:S9 family peptidase n=1 Tax=Brevundimonas bacteroides TaxID=74311 RepID=UPI00049634ED|nr:prolyl oligopeptidase family serine peptidase [Brevundimonas bacteroides]